MEKTMKKNVYICITESLCPTAEKNTSIVHQLYLNEINLRKRWPILYYTGSQIFLGWRREWLPTPAFWPGEFHGQRRLAGYSPRGRKESDMTERLSHTHTKWINFVFMIFIFLMLFSHFNFSLLASYISLFFLDRCFWPLMVLYRFGVFFSLNYCLGFQPMLCLAASTVNQLHSSSKFTDHMTRVLALCPATSGLWWNGTLLDATLKCGGVASHRQQGRIGET